MTLELPLRDLEAFHRSLIAALAEAGHGGDRLTQVFQHHLRARCLQCGVELDGTTLAEMFATTPQGQPSSARQSRLQQGYCVRNGCPSHFYQVILEPTEGIAWEPIVARARAAQAESERAVLEEQAVRRRQQAGRRRQQLLRVAGALVGLAVLWTAHYRWKTGRLPGAKPTSKYLVDPSSLRPEPATRSR